MSRTIKTFREWLIHGKPEPLIKSHIYEYEKDLMDKRFSFLPSPQHKKSYTDKHDGRTNIIYGKVYRGE